MHPSGGRSQSVGDTQQKVRSSRMVLRVVRSEIIGSVWKVVVATVVTALHGTVHQSELHIQHSVPVPVLLLQQLVIDGSLQISLPHNNSVGAIPLFDELPSIPSEHRLVEAV